MRTILATMVLLAVAGCEAKQTEAGKNMTQRQRDSAIGESRLPGAQGVRGALRVQDSAAARNARLDSIP